MKKLPVVLTGVVTLIACLLLISRDPQPAFLSAVSRQIFDVLIRRTAQPPLSDKVVVIDIDESSLKTYGQWPWPRRLLRKLTDRLFELGAEVVAFDIVFAESDRNSPRIAAQNWSREFGPEVKIKGIPEEGWDYDADFAAAISKSKTILSCYMEDSPVAVDEIPDEVDPLYRGRYFESGSRQTNFLKQASNVVVSISELQSAAASTAFFNTSQDADGIIRRIPMIMACGPKRIYSALSLESVRLFKGLDQFGIKYDDKGIEGVQELRLRDLVIPTDKQGNLVLNYRSESFSHIPAVAVLSGQDLAGFISNRVVMIGTSAAGLKDLVATPMRSETPGIDVQATAVDNMLAGDMLMEPRWMRDVNLLGVLIVGGLLVYVMGFVRAWLGFFIAMLGVGGAFGVSWWLIEESRLVVSPTEMMLSIGAIYTMMTVVKFGFEERERREIRAMFGKMVSNDVLQYMEENPDSFSLVGHKVQATVFFSDIKSFTSMAENLDPDVLSRMMNRYLTPMADLIMQRGGYVDKFYGDAIMAVWGALYESKDHAVQACLAALEQKECLQKLRPQLVAEFGCEIFVRMGIHTGVATAGNMGTEERRQFTVMGDTVNQASRMQDANKVYNTIIIIGEETRKLAADFIEVRFLDVITPKGKTQAVNIYELLCRKGESDANLREVVRLYEEALSLCRKKEWAGSLALLDQALKLRPEDGPARNLQDRIHRFQILPPPPEWHYFFTC